MPKDRREMSNRDRLIAAGKRQQVETTQKWSRTFTNDHGYEMFDLGLTKESLRTKFVIVPYVLKTDNGNPDAKVGTLFHKRRYYMHRNIGPEGLNVCCLRTFGKPCPICAEQNRMRRGDDEFTKEEIDSFRAQPRVIYFVAKRNDLKNVKLLDMSVATFDEKLVAEYTDPETEGGDKLLELKDGVYLSCRFKYVNKSATIKYFDLDSVSFPHRETDIPEKLAAKLDLDAVLREYTADELQEMLDGGRPTPRKRDDDDDEPKAKKAKPRPADDDEDDDEDEPPAKSKGKPKGKPEPDDDEDDDEDEPPAKSKGKTKPKPADDDEDEDEDEDDGEDDEDDDDEPPVKGKAKPKGRPADDDEDDDEDEDEDEPPAKPKGKAKAKPRPDDDEDDDEDEPRGKAMAKPKGKKWDDDDDDDE